MNDNHFWKHVDELLDERLDPFEDRVVQDLLRADPSKLAELERLTGRLSRLDEAPIATSRFPLGKLVLLAAGLAAVAGFSIFLRGSDDVPPKIDEVSTLELEEPPRLGVLSYRLSVTDSGSFGSRSAVVEDGRVSRTTSSQGSETEPNHTILSIESSSRRLP